MSFFASSPSLSSALRKDTYHCSVRLWFPVRKNGHCECEQLTGGRFGNDVFLGGINLISLLLEMSLGIKVRAVIRLKPQKKLVEPRIIASHVCFQMLHPKQVHFPSGYPIARSPPLFVCSSPGPDPYRSIDNVYEELGPPRDSDAESDPQPHSDDDFAEDELSLNGTAQAADVQQLGIPMATSNSTGVSASLTIPSISANVRQSPISPAGGEARASNDRNSLLSSSSASTAPANERGAIIGSQSSSSNSSCSSEPTRVASPDSGLALRNRSTRGRNYSADKLNAGDRQSGRGEHSRMTLPYNHHRHHAGHQHFHHPAQAHGAAADHAVAANNNLNNNSLEISSNYSDSSISNHLNNVNNNVGDRSSDIDHQNQINKQIVSTIFPGRLIASNHMMAGAPPARHHRAHYNAPDEMVRCANYSNRSRTNPRAISGRQRCDNSLPAYDYSYAEPLVRNEMFDVCAPPLLSGFRTISAPHSQRPQHYYPSYAAPLDQQCGPHDPRVQMHSRSPHGQSIYSHDSSFGSDSGYSQYTHNGRPKASAGDKHAGRGSGGALNNVFGWRRKDSHPATAAAASAGHKKTLDKPTMRNS